MPNRWIHERKNDHYHQRAKEEGYRSRASYKLKQIQNKFGVFDDASYVLDLGAAPGGWLQVAAEFIPEDGLVVGVDLDVRDPAVQEEVIGCFEGKADVVMSDMAQDVMGEWDVDQYRQIHLARIALRIADRLLKPDGWFVVKIFQGGEHQRFIREVKAMFEYVKNYKPRASRKQSAERYIVAKGLKPDRKPPREQGGLDEEEDEGPLPGDQLFQDPGY